MISKYECKRSLSVRSTSFSCIIDRCTSIKTSFSLAPSSSPQNVMLLALSPTSIGVTFVPPLGINQNGPNLVYNITFTGQTFETNTQFITVTNLNALYPATAALSADITGLEEYNNYTIRVSAVNIEGESELTTGEIQITDIAGSISNI